MLGNVVNEYYYVGNYNYGYDNDSVDDSGGDSDNDNDNDDYYYSSTAQVVPSWNVTITYKTISSLTVRWSTFPLNVPIQRFLVKYKEKNSNVSLIYHVSNWYNSHYTGNTLKGYTFYEVNVVAETSGNGTLYSSDAITARTQEGGKYAKTIKQTNKCESRKIKQTIKTYQPIQSLFLHLNFRRPSLNLVFHAIGSPYNERVTET